MTADLLVPATYAWCFSSSHPVALYRRVLLLRSAQQQASSPLSLAAQCSSLTKYISFCLCIRDCCHNFIIFTVCLTVFNLVMLLRSDGFPARSSVIHCCQTTAVVCACNSIVLALLLWDAESLRMCTCLSSLRVVSKPTLGGLDGSSAPSW